MFNSCVSSFRVITLKQGAGHAATWLIFAICTLLSSCVDSIFLITKGKLYNKNVQHILALCTKVISTIKLKQNEVLKMLISDVSHLGFFKYTTMIQRMAINIVK